MAGMGIQANNVTGRNFTSGLAKEIFDWCTKTYSLHGANWTVWDDQRSLSTNPYFVMCDQVSPTPMSRAMFFQVMVDSTTNQLILQPYLYWNNSTQVGLGQFQRLLLATYDTQFAYRLHGGPNIIFLATRSGSVTRHARLSKFQGWWDGVWKLLEPESTNGTLVNAAFLETDPSGYLSGYHNLTGYETLLPASGELEFDIVLVSGSTYRIDIYKSSTHSAGNLIGHTANFTNTATGAKSITADNVSGLGGTITTDITVAAATGIKCRFLRLDLGAGEGANFVAGRPYFLIYITATTIICRNLKVTSKTGDQLIVDSIGANNFPAGSFISPYPHRWICTGSQQQGSFNGNAQIPYPSVPGSELANYQSSPALKAISYDWLQAALRQLNPDRMGHYPGMGALLVETNGNSAYGSEIETILDAPGALNNLQDTRTIGAVSYLAFDVQSSVASLVRNSESLS